MSLADWQCSSRLGAHACAVRVMVVLLRRLKGTQPTDKLPSAQQWQPCASKLHVEEVKSEVEGGRRVWRRYRRGCRLQLAVALPAREHACRGSSGSGVRVSRGVSDVCSETLSWRPQWCSRRSAPDSPGVEKAVEVPSGGTQAEQGHHWRWCSGKLSETAQFMRVG